eukprot:12920619-Alexandrium_andersonii.AAC.1
MDAMANPRLPWGLRPDMLGLPETTPHHETSIYRAREDEISGVETPPASTEPDNAFADGSTTITKNIDTGQGTWLRVSGVMCATVWPHC